MPEISIRKAVRAKVPGSLFLPCTTEGTSCCAPGQPCFRELEGPWCSQPSRSSVWSGTVRRERLFVGETLTWDHEES